MYPFFFSNLFFIFFPHLEKVYHFWMCFGCAWNPGPCYLHRNKMMWGDSNPQFFGPRWTQPQLKTNYFFHNVMKTASTYLKKINFIIKMSSKLPKLAKIIPEETRLTNHLWLGAILKRVTSKYYAPKNCHYPSSF